MTKKEEKMKLPKVTIDDFLSTQEERNIKNLEVIQNIDINNIVDFPEHPFKVRDDEKMMETIDSVKKYGVLVPAIVRPKGNNTYEMVAGHRRKRACKLAQLDKMPCIVRELTDEEATIIMVDTNLQREEILPSERAFAYKMKLEAIKSQGKRNDLTSTPVEEKLSVEVIAEQVGESREQVRRYIRLTELIPELLKLVDEKKIALRPAVELSYLKEDEQYTLFDIIEYMDVTPSHAQAIRLRRLSQEENLTSDKIDEIMGEIKSNQVEKVKISFEKLRNILPKSVVEQNKIEEFIINCINDYNKRVKQQKMKER